MVLYGVVPECPRSVSGMVPECIMSAKMVSLSASGTVTLVPHGIFCSNFIYLCILTLSSKWYEASPSIILAGRALLGKMLITLEPCGIFGSNFVYICILTLSRHWYERRIRGFTEHHFGLSSSLGENAHNS